VNNDQGQPTAQQPQRSSGRSLATDNRSDRIEQQRVIAHESANATRERLGYNVTVDLVTDTNHSSIVVQSTELKSYGIPNSTILEWKSIVQLPMEIRYQHSRDANAS